MRTYPALLVSLALALPALATELSPRDVARIVEAAAQSQTAYELLGELCDRHPLRFSGTPELEIAIDWCAEQMRARGLSNVRKEKVMVPHWIRGEESARLLEPVPMQLNILGLGRSVGTPNGPLRAEVVVVENFEQLAALPDANVAGKIVLFDAPFVDYGTTVRYRGSGASAAARRGAVAALVRSVGPISYDTPHTGSLRYEEDAPQIPAAAVTIEASSMLRRMAGRGDRIMLELSMQAREEGEALSHNLLGELIGRELPEEIVLVSGHIDAWDVGQGAQDDGTGCMIAMGATLLLRELGITPRRTIRVVFWTNEENGLRGARQYVTDHQAELPLHVAAIESDSGNGLADGFRLEVHAEGFAALGAAADSARATAERGVVAHFAALAPHLATVGATSNLPGGSGADVGALARAGVLGVGMNHDTSHYFDVHHTRADSFEKIVPADLNRNVAAMAVLLYCLAESETRPLAWPAP